MELSDALKEKVHKSFDEQRFVGIVQYSEEEYEELLAYTREYSRFFASGCSSYLKGDDKVHFVTLVEIAKRWKMSNNDSDEESRFWPFVFSVIEVRQSWEQRLYNAYTELIMSLSCNMPLADTAKKYYATIMMHAFAPHKSMHSFFNLIYNIFKRDLDCNYTDVDVNICDMVTECFCTVAQKLGDRNKDISIGSSSYGIKIGLRSMALGCDTRRDFSVLIHKVLVAINALFHNKEVFAKDYVLYLLKEWWNSITVIILDFYIKTVYNKIVLVLGTEHRLY